MRSDFSFTRGYWYAVCDRGRQIGIRLLPFTWVVLWFDFGGNPRY